MVNRIENILCECNVLIFEEKYIEAMVTVKERGITRVGVIQVPLNEWKAIKADALKQGNRKGKQDDTLDRDTKKPL